MTQTEILSSFQLNSGMHFSSSGSTGKPKTFFFNSQQIIRSCERTAKFFKLQNKAKVFSALPLQFVGGKMMVLRAHLLDWELDLQQPSATPQINSEYEFAVFTPHQFIRIYQQNASSLNRIKKILLGGSALPSNRFPELLNNVSSDVYLGYGMTETLTHIAISNLKMNLNEYSPLPGVEVAIDENSRILVQDHELKLPLYLTDDLGEHVGTRFKVLGRVGNVINSGGLKLIPEQIEQKIASILEIEFYITSKPNEELGEIVVLVAKEEISSEQRVQIEKVLHKYEFPKEYLRVDHFEYTTSGKIIRKNSSQ
jgi:o-succinylbenzoate---CoA ligase